MKLTNIFKHFAKITKHKWLVFKLSIKAGIPFRGLVHDLSKYSWTEFSESVKYYQGTRSPITRAREVQGYSIAWLHHKGRNKHHHQYWYDPDSYDENVHIKNHAIMMPFKYVVELICDNLAAGMNYQGKNWHQGFQLEYFTNKESRLIANETLKKVLLEIYTKIAENGVYPTIKKNNLKKIYDKHVK